MLKKRVTQSVILLVLSAVALIGCTGASDVTSTAGSTGSADNLTPPDLIPPNGTPPNGTTPGGTTPGGSESSSSYVLNGVYTLDGQIATQSDGA